MKRKISILLCIVLIFSSFSFASAVDWSTTDSNNLATIKNSVISGGQLYNVVNACNTVLNNINYNIVTLMGWLDPSSGGSTYSLLNQILNTLVYSDAAGNIKSWLADIWQTNAVYLPALDTLKISLSNTYQDANSFTLSQAKQNSHRNLVDYPNSTYTLKNISTYGQFTTSTINWTFGSPIGNVALILKRLNDNYVQGYTDTYNHTLSGFNSQQSFIDWENLNISTFNPNSQTNGIYSWLKNIQAPVARLSYVLASDQRIEAQELAADNEQAVVDNFIDSTGSGAASTSDIDSIAGFSSGYKSTFASDASPTGIFDLFNSSNMGWFSQETANQLDTTSNNRAKSDNTFNTPLLDQQINSIYEQLGVKQP